MVSSTPPLPPLPLALPPFPPPPSPLYPCPASFHFIRKGYKAPHLPLLLSPLDMRPTSGRQGSGGLNATLHTGIAGLQPLKCCSWQPAQRLKDPACSPVRWHGHTGRRMGVHISEERITTLIKTRARLTNRVLLAHPLAIPAATSSWVTEHYYWELSRELCHQRGAAWVESWPGGSGHPTARGVDPRARRTRRGPPPS